MFAIPGLYIDFVPFILWLYTHTHASVLRPSGLYPGLFRQSTITKF